MSTTETVTTATDKVDAFLDKLVALGGELVDAAKPLADVATDAALTAVHFNGVLGITASAAMLLLATVGGYGAARLIKHANSEAAREDNTDVPSGVGGVILGVASAILFIAGCVRALDADTWMALLRPDAYLAAKALGL